MAPDPAPGQAWPTPPPPTTVAGWVRSFDSAHWPVLASTADALEDWRANEDAADAHLLAEALGNDPLMTLKLLRHVAALHGQREHTDAETTTEALVMLGITPFFRDFGPQPTVEQQLQSRPEALRGLRAVLRRSDRAARFALGFAAHRMDHDAAVIHQAALLHDFAELLLWLQAPALALGIEQTLAAHPDIEPAQAQMPWLGVALGDVQQALMQRWRLPGLLVRITDDHASPLRQVRNVQLAIRVARHSADGWIHPALADDVDQIAQLLNLGTAPTLHLLHELDAPPD